MPYEYVTATGTIVPDTTDTRDVVQAEYKVALGQNMNTAPATPQGRLIDGETVSRNAAARNNAQLANQFNPNLNGGVYLDASLALLGSERNNNTYTVVSENLAGSPNLFIPANILIQNSVTNEIFMTVSSLTLDSSGNGAVNVQALNPGPISADPGTLTILVASTLPLGLETATNPAGPISLGTLTQSDESAGNFRLQTLSAQGRSQAEAMLSGLNLTPNVSSAIYRANDFPTTRVIDGITMLPNSIYVCVAGGADIDVANTMNNEKGPGAQYNGSTSVTLTDPFSGQTFDVLFDRPTAINILVRVTAQVNGSIADPVSAIKNAINDYQLGNISGLPGLTIGTPVSAFELAGACTIEIPEIFITNLQISLTSPVDYSSTLIPIGLNQQAYIPPGNIAVVLI